MIICLSYLVQETR